MNNGLIAQGITLPRINGGGNGVIDPFNNTLTIGVIVTRIVPYIMAFAGIAMLCQILLGGFTLLTSTGDQAAMKRGYGSIQFGAIGFFIVFCSYFAVVIAEAALGVKIF